MPKVLIESQQGDLFIQDGGKLHRLEQLLLLVLEADILLHAGAFEPIAHCVVLFTIITCKTFIDHLVSSSMSLFLERSQDVQKRLEPFVVENDKVKLVEVGVVEGGALFAVDIQKSDTQARVMRNTVGHGQVAKMVSHQ